MRLIDAIEIALEKMGHPATAAEIATFICDHPVLNKSLSGATPHKTVQARISVHILKNSDRSPFYRLAPAKFGLVRLARAGAYGMDSRVNLFIGRPRRREVDNSPVLAVRSEHLKGLSPLFLYAPDTIPLSSIKMLPLEYVPGRTAYHSKDITRVMSYFAIVHEENVLIYETTGYKKINENSIGRTTIGFSDSIRLDDITLFDGTGIGFYESIKRLFFDFFYFCNFGGSNPIMSIEYAGLLRDDVSGHHSRQLGIAAIVRTNTRLTVEGLHLGASNLHWTSTSYKPNHYTTMETWSKFLFERIQT